MPCVKSHEIQTCQAMDHGTDHKIVQSHCQGLNDQVKSKQDIAIHVWSVIYIVYEEAYTISKKQKLGNSRKKSSFLYHSHFMNEWGIYTLSYSLN